MPTHSCSSPVGTTQTTAEPKSAWRTRLRGMRAALAADAQLHAALSERLQRHLMASTAWLQASTVLLYYAVRGEVDTALLRAEAWASGRSVFLPRCRPQEKGRMDIVPCPGPEVLKPGSMGIPEPWGNPVPESLWPDLLRNTLIVVPALAFDREGYRLGYGGGYYDRLFAAARLSGPEAGRGYRVGLAFAGHVFDRLPRDPWDIPVNALCTEEVFTWI